MIRKKEASPAKRPWKKALTLVAMQICITVTFLCSTIGEVQANEICDERPIHDYDVVEMWDETGYIGDPTEYDQPNKDYWATTTKESSKAGEVKLTNAEAAAPSPLVCKKEMWLRTPLIYNYDMLSAYQNHYLYYWNAESDAQTKWVFENPGDPEDDCELISGRYYNVKNVYWNEYLWPEDDYEWATTKTEPHAWEVSLKTCPNK